MIALERAEKPPVLEKNASRWGESYLKKCTRARSENKNSPRPNSKQYGHREVRRFLAAISQSKCFYCEQKLAENDWQVDHYLDVANYPEKAFEWENLYLACKDCNQAKKSTVADIEDCIDPFHPGFEPLEHFVFDCDIIFAAPGSSSGQATINKLNLTRAQLNYLRLKELLKFEKSLGDLKAKSSGASYEKKLQSLFQCVTDKSYPFSLMFRFVLQDYMD